MADPKKNRKLSSFFKEKEKVKSRYNAILSFAESNPPEPEERKFYTESYESIFSILHERFVKLEEGSFKKGKGSKDLTQMLDILKKLLLYVPAVINTRWEIDRIGGIINKSLLRGNQQEVRLKGFELLLYFIEALQNSIQQEQLDQFATAINLYPFLEGQPSNTTLKYFPKDQEKNMNALILRTDPVSKKDAVQLLEFFFDFITNKTATFPFWFNLFKEKYLMTFYPTIFQELRLMDKYDVSGFKTMCPPEIQAVLIEKTQTWGDRPNIFQEIWDPNCNGPLMLEIHRQSCLIPLSFFATIKKSTQLFRSWLMSTSKNKIFQEQLQQYWQQFIKNLALIFHLTPVDSTEVENLHALCKEVIYIYNNFAVELSTKLTTSTWETLQFTTLSITFELFNKASNPKILELLNFNSPNVQTSENCSFADHMFGALYFFWIRSQITTDDMWREISKKVNSLANWKANVVQWREKVLQLTYILRDILYKIKEDTTSLESVEPSKPGKKDDVFVNSVGVIPTHLRSPVEFLRDPRLTGMNWKPETIRNVWYIVLFLLGNISKITDPTCHEIAMSCIHDVAEILITAEQKLPSDVEPPIPIMKDLLPWLVESCVFEEKLTKGIIVAYQTVGILFCRRHVRMNNEIKLLLTHYYRFLQMGLNNVKVEIISCIIETSLSLFSLNLPGVIILATDFLREIETLVTSQQASSTPAIITAKHNALTIVNSLVCYPAHFEPLKIPAMLSSKSLEIKENLLSIEEFRDKIIKIYSTVLTNSKEDPNIFLLAISGTTVLIFDELSGSSPRMAVISKCVKLILDLVDHPDENISKTSIECIVCISHYFEKITSLDKALIVTIITFLSEKIIELIQKSKNKQEVVISDIFYGIREWLLASSTDILADKEIGKTLFQAIEFGLLGDMLEARLSSSSPPPTPLDGSKIRFSKKDQKRASSIEDLHKHSNSIDKMFKAMKNEPTHGSLMIREAAESVLYQLLNQFNNFPCRGGVQVLGSTLHEYEENEASNVVYFSYYDSVIFACVDTVSSSGVKTARLIIRDATGKYVWDSVLVPDAPVKEVKQPEYNEIPPIEKVNEPQITYTRPKGELPKFDPKLRGIDMMKEVLSYLSEAHPEIILEPIVVEPSYEAPIKDQMKAINDQMKTEEGRVIENSKLPVQKLPEQELTPRVSISALNMCRLLLSHLGFLTEEGRKKLKLLDANQRFFRSLKELDQLLGRELLKIGVIYVAEGQEDQKEILKNSSGSELYNEFLRGLGWMVDLKTHTGFLGGLTSQANGSISPYYATSSQEVMFHVVTLLPTSDSDPQQIEKKKHVGNDFVHIVWNEHFRLYRPTTITSNFNDAHIVIHPLTNGMFKIQIFRKEKIPFFGPLTDGMVLSKKLLAPLVRFTAFYANSRVRNATKGYKKPFPTRQAFIKEMMERYKTEKSFGDFMFNFFPNKFTSAPKGTQSSPSSPSSDPKQQSGWLNAK